MKLIKEAIRKTPLFAPLKYAYRKLKKIPRHPLQGSKTVSGYDYIYLGTEYGGWSLVDDPQLYGSTIISAGLGEDASFDIEFAAKFGARIIIVDPTPRSVAHFRKIETRLGMKRTIPYGNLGCQPIESYDLSSVSTSNLSLVEKALWNKSTTLKFFSPVNPRNVSHSIVNYQQQYRTDSESIEVPTTTVIDLIDDFNLQGEEIPLIKLDIEGAEIEVIEHMMALGIQPRQILVEFDELNVGSERGFTRVSKIDSLLVEAGYKMLQTNGQADFLYFKDGL